MNLLTKLFGAPEEINGAHRCPTYLYRWEIIRRKDWQLYLHKFTGNDWSRDLHDHPKRFVSIGLWGSYLEETPADGPDKPATRFKRWRAPWFRSFPANHAHRLTTPWGTCWTLVIVLRTEREWGFWHDGTWIQWKEYVRGKFAGVATMRKDC